MVPQNFLKGVTLSILIYGNAHPGVPEGGVIVGLWLVYGDGMPTVSEYPPQSLTINKDESGLECQQDGNVHFRVPNLLNAHPRGLGTSDSTWVSVSGVECRQLRNPHPRVP